MSHMPPQSAMYLTTALLTVLSSCQAASPVAPATTAPKEASALATTALLPERDASTDPGAGSPRVAEHVLLVPSESPVPAEAAAPSPASLLAAESDTTELSAIFQGLRSQVKAGRRRGQMGESEQLGSYYLVVIGLKTGTADPLVEGRLQSMKEIGSFIGVEVESETEFVKRTETTGVGEEKKTEFFKSLTTSTTTRVQQTLAGVELIGVTESESVIHVAYALTERGVQNVASLTEMLDARTGPEGEQTVRAIGAAQGRGDQIDEAQLRELAINDGLRTAIRKVAGGVIVAQSKSEGRQFLEEKVYSATSGTYTAYEVLSSGLSGTLFQVELAVTVDANQIAEDFRSHLEVLGSPRFYFDEKAAGEARFIRNGETELGRSVRNFLSEKGFPMVASPEGADYQFWLDSTWQKGASPVPGLPPMLQLTGDIYWVDRAGKQHSILSSDGRCSTDDKPQAAKILTRRFMEQNERAILEGLNSKLSEFQANGREVRVILRGAAFKEAHTLSGLLKQDPFVKDARAELGADEYPILTVRTFLRSDDLAGTIQAVAGGAGSGALELLAAGVQTSEIVFVVDRPAR